MADRAELMREAAREHILSQVDAFAPEFRADDPRLDFLRVLAAEIGALPLPPQPPLADDVAGVLKWLRPSAMIGANKAADLIERLARELADAEAAIDSIETSHGLTDRGNLWRWWREKCREFWAQRTEANARAAQAEAEVARLRKVANSLDPDGGRGFAEDYEEGYRAAIEDARAAITTKGANHA